MSSIDTEQHHERSQRRRTRIVNYPINNGVLTGPAADRVVLIFWTLDINGGTCDVAADSAIYSLAEVMTKYNGSLAAFAADAGYGTLKQMTPSPLPANPDQHPQLCDFAIDRSCYIVFVLRDAYHDWIFQPHEKAVDFKDDETGWYSNLLHVRSNGSTSTNAGLYCKACYFSARVEPDNGDGTDAFTLYFQFDLGAAPTQVKDYDPAIKNKGHNKFNKLHFATPFELSAFAASLAGR